MRMSSPMKVQRDRAAPDAPMKIKISAQVQFSEEAQVFKAFFKLQDSGLCNMLEAPVLIKRRFPELSDSAIDEYHERYITDYDALKVLYGH